MIIININGLEPVAKGRARSAKSGHHYTPTKTRKFEEAVRLSAIAQMRRNGYKILSAGVLVDIVLRFPIPSSWPKWKKEMALNGELDHTTKPDSSNVCKAIEDALNGVVWNDDSQIVDSTVMKRYSSTPGIIVCAEPSSRISAQAAKRPK